MDAVVRSASYERPHSPSGQSVYAYVDDVFIISRKRWEVTDWVEEVRRHVDKVRQFLAVCRRYRVYLSVSKRQVMRPVVDILGHRVRVGERIEVDPDRAAAIAAMKVPGNLRELESFLGVVNYVAKFIPDASARRAPLYR